VANPIFLIVSSNPQNSLLNNVIEEIIVVNGKINKIKILFILIVDDGKIIFFKQLFLFYTLFI
jgi:hypothetical protein